MLVTLSTFLFFVETKFPTCTTQYVIYILVYDSIICMYFESMRENKQNFILFY
jgi:hypothetical protein